MIGSMKHRAARLTVAFVLALAANVSLADGPRAVGDSHAPLAYARHGQSRDWEDDDRSHDRARRASAAGEILTIAEIYEHAARAVPGRVLETDLERAQGHWVYELTILDPAGRIFDLELDAATGQVLERDEGT